MFKLVVLFALAAVAVAKPAPGYLHGGVALAPAVTYGHAVVGHIPTAVSHSSSSIVHSSVPVAAPVAIAAPVAYHAAPALVAAPAIAYGGYGGHGHLGWKW